MPREWLRWFILLSLELSIKIFPMLRWGQYDLYLSLEYGLYLSLLCTELINNIIRIKLMRMKRKKNSVKPVMDRVTCLFTRVTNTKYCRMTVGGFGHRVGIGCLSFLFNLIREGLLAVCHNAPSIFRGARCCIVRRYGREAWR
jgi:hypothetical protein